MTRTALLSRPAGLALCLLAISATGGCTRFRYAMAHPSAAAAQREAREQAAAHPAALPPAPPAPPAPVEMAPVQAAPVQAAPTAQPAAPAQAEPATPSAAEQRKARAEALKAEQEARKQARAQDKAARHIKSKEPAQTAAPAREPIFDQAPAPAPVAPAPVEAAPVTEAPVANTPADRAIIMFSNTPGAHCTACDTIKISVAPSGKVLIERGRWAGDNRDWRYRKSVAHVSPARAAAFAARVNGYRPTGDKALGSCPASSGDGLSVEWIAAERHDRLTVSFACSDAQAAEALRHAPDLLGLSQLNFAWGAR